MATKTPKTTKPAVGSGRLPGVLDGTETHSQALARLVTHSTGASNTIQQYAKTSDNLNPVDLMVELRRVGDEAVAGNLGRFEHLLATQALTLDLMFHNLAQRAGRQHDIKNLEALMRLALKAQTQARATIETLATVKNPVPYIRQANIAHGHQQVNNGSAPRAGKRKTAPNKLMETHHERLDRSTPATPGRADQALEAVAAGHGAED